MEQLIEFGIFVAKLVVVLAFFAILLSLIAGIALKAKRGSEIEFENLNEKFQGLVADLIPIAFEKKKAKKLIKALKKLSENIGKDSARVFVLDFKGDVSAKQVEELRDEVSTILAIAQPGDEVLVRIESPGGTVHGYGLGASQLRRIKDAGLNLTASVDKIAASGGYLMAATAHKIIAAPFAIVGSIGVVAQVPNLHRLLKKNNVDYEEITSGEYKRTVSFLGEITDKGRKKFTEQIEDTHALFKEFVGRERPQVLMDQVATGEYWFGERALGLKLVDELQTSDEYLFKKRETNRLLKLKIYTKKSLSDKLSEAVQSRLGFSNYNSWL